MTRKKSIAEQIVQIDRRMWLMVLGIGVLGFLVMREVSLPTPVLLGCAGLAGIALLFLGLESPEIPLYALVAYLPFSRMLVGDFGTSMTAFNLTNMLMAWLFIAHAIRQANKKEPIFEGTPLSNAIWMFCLMGTVALLKASWDFGSFYLAQNIIDLKRWLTPMMFYFLALWTVRDRRTLKTVVALIMFALVVVALMAIRDYMYVADTSDLEKARVGGIAEHSNSLGAFFCYYMFLFPGVMLAYPKKFKSWLLLIPFLLCFRGIMVTFSRGAYLAFAFGSLVFAWFRSKWLLLAAFLLALFAVVNPWILPSGIRYRLGQTVQDPSVLQEANLESLEQGLESSASTRLTLWKGAVRMIAEHPFTGVGYGAFPHFIPYYVDPEKEVPHMDAHNSYLLIAAEMGVPTLLVFLVVVAMAFHYTAWLARHTQDTLLKGMAYGFIGGLGGLLMANMFGSRMDAQQVSGYFWILCGLMMRGVLIERQGAAALAAVPVKRRVKTVSF